MRTKCNIKEKCHEKKRERERKRNCLSCNLVCFSSGPALTNNISIPYFPQFYHTFNANTENEKKLFSLKKCIERHGKA
jgi:hypothetical protein